MNIQPYRAPMLAGLTCLDFVNTAPNRHPDREREYLKSYYEFIDWCQDAGLIEMEYNNWLTVEANYQITDRKTAYAKMLGTRQLLDDLFSAIATGKPHRPDIAGRLNAALAEVQGHTKFMMEDGKLIFDWDYIPEELEVPRWLLVKQALDILMQEAQGVIKICPGCRSFYLDRTKSRNRRWCSPHTCGSKLKNRKYYLSQQEEAK